MRIKSKEILFYPHSQFYADFTEPPLPSYKTNIPEIYKNINKYNDGNPSFVNYGGPKNNLTIKSCMPVIDAYTSGYTISLPYDIQVHKDKNGLTSITWAMIFDGMAPFINERPKTNDIICPWENIEGYDPIQFNWNPYWSIKTPKGYSCMVIHPINRIDLPFYTTGGILDTDGWGVSGNQPFLIKKGWTGIIEAGTPIMQIIPFKRDDWNSYSDKTMTEEYKKQIFQKETKLKNFYKKQYWKQKRYR